MVNGASKRVDAQTYEDAIRVVMSTVDKSRIRAIGHRVVHGGEWYSRPVIINNKVCRRIRSLCELAPLHNKHNLQAYSHARGSCRM